MASKYVLLLSKVTTKICVHNVRYICNVIKICLTLMASKYAQFSSDVINKIYVHMCTQICVRKYV